MSGSVVLGLDVGTTSAKAVAFDAAGREWGRGEVEYPLRRPEPGAAEQDPLAVLAAALDVLGTAAGQARDAGSTVAGVALGTAMHGLLGLDADGHPTTPLLTWADTRARGQARRLRRSDAATRLQRRSGTPVHTMSPLVKLVWLAETAPDVVARTVTWGGMKELLLRELTGEAAVDVSVAGATGLLALDRLDWDAEALDVAGLSAASLAPLVPAQASFPLLPSAARRLGLPAGLPVVAGGGDGALATLGVGVVGPGTAACSIGTSAALRVLTPAPVHDDAGTLFCYPLTDDRFVVGGALNNGGNVLRWLRETLVPELAEGAEEHLLDLAGRVPAGSEGLLLLPQLLGERAPTWADGVGGAYLGLRDGTRREHLVRSALEGVCLQLATVLASFRPAGIEVGDVRATGGFARSPLWRQVLADVLDLPVGFPATRDGAALGAALLGLHSLGLVDDLDAAARRVPVVSTCTPGPDAATYAGLLPVFRDAQARLEPVLAALDQVAAAGPTTSP